MPVSTAFVPRWTSAAPHTITRPTGRSAPRAQVCALRRFADAAALRPASYDAVLFADVDLDELSALT